jgi:hypothetical protein
MAIEQNGAVCSQIGNRQLPLLVALMASCIHWAPAPIVCTYSCGYGGCRTGPFGPFGPHEQYGPGGFLMTAHRFYSATRFPYPTFPTLCHHFAPQTPQQRANKRSFTRACVLGFIRPPCIRRIGAFNPHASGPHRLPGRPESGRPPSVRKVAKRLPTCCRYVAPH